MMGADHLIEFIAKVDRVDTKGSFRQVNISIYLVDF